jgi:hypothetical protein
MGLLPSEGSAVSTAVFTAGEGGRFAVRRALLAVATTLAVLALGGCNPVGELAIGADDRLQIAERLDPPVAPGSMAPELAAVDGRLALLWLEPAATDKAGGHRLRFAHLDDDGWSEPSTVAGPEESFFANWADRPQVIQGGDGALIATWLAKNGDSTYAYEVRAARSDDGGATWRPLGRLHGDGQPAEHGFVSLTAEDDGVRAVWLDGRNTPDGEPMALYTGLVGEVAVSGGEIEDDSGAARDEIVLDSSVCDCCDTALTRSGDGLVIAYRDRSAEEMRDISVVRQTADGWSEPVALNDDGWRIAACPVNGPALASLGETGETVWAVWYTAADGLPRVRSAVSSDGGASFSEPVDLAGGEGEEPPLGRVDLVATPAGDALAVWLDTRDGTAEIRAARLGADGSVGEAASLVVSDSSRASGVPRLMAVGDGLYLAWVEPGDGGGIRLARLAMSTENALPGG